MKASLDKFILSFPVLFIKQYPYAWIAVVILWTWPPNISIIFLAAMLLGIVSLHWRAAAWVATMRREYAPGGAGFLVQRAPIPWSYATRRILMLLAIAGVMSGLASTLVGLGFWQFFIIIVGFALTYMDTRLLGAQTIYVVTETCIAIYFVPGHLDYRIIVRFKEVGQVQRLDNIEKLQESWSVCSSLRKPKSGLLLVPRNPYGFSKQLQEILITPTDTDEFIKRIPSTLTNEF